MFGEGFLSLVTNKDAFDLIFPRNCLHCGDIVPEQSKLLYLCPDCLRESYLLEGHLDPGRDGSVQVEVAEEELHRE